MNETERCSGGKHRNFYATDTRPEENHDTFKYIHTPFRLANIVYKFIDR